MASSSDVRRKVTRFKLQLADTAESATVVKILQKLRDLDITLEILVETGIGKTVNSLRRHEEAGELAKSLVRDWKRLVPKESKSPTEHGDVSESLSVKEELDDQNCPSNGSLSKEDSNNNWLTSQKSQDSSEDALFKTESSKVHPEKQGEEQKRHWSQNENLEQQENQHITEKNVEIQQDRIDNSVVSKRMKKDESNRKSRDSDTLSGNKHSEDTPQQSSSECGRFSSGKESNKKPKESSKQGKESFSFESRDTRSEMFKSFASESRDRRSEIFKSFAFEPREKRSEMLNLASVNDDSSSIIARSSEAQNKKMSKEKRDTLKCKQESEEKGHSKNKKAKTKHRDGKSEAEDPSLSFESCLNYDVKISKRTGKLGVNKPRKTVKTVVKEEARKGPGMKPFRSPVMSLNVTSPTRKFKESVMELIPFTIPLPDVLPEYEEPMLMSHFNVDYFERKVEKESDFCDVSEESVVFTGQRLNKKMQVYSGAKTVFLPTMMSLSQQCIRTLQNNINRISSSVLYETGGVPFDILEPVLERCTPEQLLRIEECNPIYVGETDHLWGKHCERDFKHSKLQEYESWKEMHLRLSEERERKLKRLTKTIVSAHSSKPKGRQVKMAFIHTVAKPPRDVRIQQEIHGTAVQQPQLKCSVKVQDNRPRPSNEPSRSNSASSGATNTQDPRKKTRVAPMMAKSLKAFKKQLGRR